MIVAKEEAAKKDENAENNENGEKNENREYMGTNLAYVPFI